MSSHLVFSSDLVPTPSGIKNVRSRTIANCLYRRGRMVDEWVRDSLAHALQLGEDPAEIARSMHFAGYQPSWTNPAPADVLAVGEFGPAAERVPQRVRGGAAARGRGMERPQSQPVNELFERDLFCTPTGTRRVRPS